MDTSPLPSLTPRRYSSWHLGQAIFALAGIAALAWVVSLDHTVWWNTRISHEPLWYRMAFATQEPFVLAIAVTFVVSISGRPFMPLPRWIVWAWTGSALAWAVYGVMAIRAEWELAPGDTIAMAELTILVMATTTIVTLYALGEVIAGIVALFEHRFRPIDAVEFVFWLAAIFALHMAER